MSRDLVRLNDGNYLLHVDGRQVVIRRHVFSARDRRDLGLPKVMFEPELGDVQTTLKGAVAEARDAVRSEPYVLIVGTRTRPDLPGLRVDLSFDEGTRLIESLRTLDDDLVFQLNARVDVPAAA